MEFPELGERCSSADCKSLEFLPFKCDYCSSIFCKDHFSPDSHLCEKIPVISADPNLSISKNVVCTTEGCSSMDAVTMNCSKCLKHFCLAHRHHGCFDFSEEEKMEARNRWIKPREEFEKSLQIVNAKIDKNLEKSKKSGKNKETALKVQLMRLKGKANGSKTIPVDLRIYFLVYLPKSIKGKSKAVFVSKEWTIGRVIDSIASTCDVPNRNNETNSSKLRLFKKSDGFQISSEMSFTVGNCIENASLYNGDSLILEYIAQSQLLPNYALTDYVSYSDS